MVTEVNHTDHEVYVGGGLSAWILI